jgi:hypothetical protein
MLEYVTELAQSVYLMKGAQAYKVIEIQLRGN